MLRSPRSFVLAGAAVLLAFSPAGDSVEFHPADGSDLEKKFTLEGDFQLGDFSMIVDGQDMSGQIPVGEVSGDFDVALSVVDHYLKTEGGKPLHLERDYSSSTASFSAMENSDSKENLFDVDGETVVFKWDAENGEYVRSYKDGEGDEEKLADLGIDLDYRALLPGKSVAAGDKWEVAPKALVTALFFGAEMKDLAELSADDAEFAALADEILPEIEKLFDSFKAQCEYVGPRDESGKQVGEVKVSVNSDGTADLTEAILAAVQAQTEGSGAEFDIQTANFTIKMRGEGKLMWDLAGGHAESFEMDSEVELLVEIAASVSDPNGGDHTVEANVEFAAHMKWSME
jgi:hypothetical protein